MIGMLYGIKLPVHIAGISLNVAMILLIFAVVYYFTLSSTLWIGLFLFALLCLVLCHFIERAGIFPLWLICVILFVAAWIGQFYGHNVEGKKPSFFKDLQFLLIGPAWLMSFIYKKLGIGF